MKELLLYIARSLVQHPDQVTVTEVETGDELTQGKAHPVKSCETPPAPDGAGGVLV